MYPPAYFPPAYFPSTYFGDPAPPSGGAGTVPCDRDVFDVIVGALLSTGEFAAVALAAPAAAGVPADGLPMAVVTPLAWSESDDLGSGGLLRRVTYSVTLVVRDPDPAARYRQADRLSSVIQDELNGVDLGGGCLRGLTRMRRGRYDLASVPPEQRVVLDGEFTYEIPNPSGRDTAA